MKRTARRVRAALLVSSLLLYAACAPTYADGYAEAFAAGQRALQAGRHDEAARAFADAAQKGRRVKDRDEARFMEARELARIGRYADARRAYEKLLADDQGPRTARAAFEIAELDIEHGDAAAGWKRLYSAAKSHPQHGLAARAVQQLAAHAAEEGGEEARLAWLRERAADFNDTDAEQLFVYQTALSLERLGRASDAHDAFISTAARSPYPFGAYTDDALWRAALIDEEMARPKEAIDHLRKLLSSRETSTSMGSYERPRYSEAQLKIAEIYRDRLKDRAAARLEFHKLYAEHTTSTRRDDALWAEAVILHEDKDQSGACEAVTTLMKELPDSRYARCATELCPTAPRLKRACSGYIVRKLRGDDTDEGESKSNEAGAAPPP